MEALILSWALDTNGQNTRFAKAAERWGTDPDILKIMALGPYDAAGVVGRYQIAADKLGGLVIRSANRAEAYFKFPRDIVWDHTNDKLVRQLAAEADIIHLNNSERAAAHLRLNKPTLLHHHGSMLRRDPKRPLQMSKQMGWVQAVSTVDLMRYDPEVLHWQPTAYDIDELEAFGKQHRRKADGRIKLVAAPTNPEYKSTARLEVAVAQLQGEGLPLDFEVVTNLTWAECMAIKATADIYFDQIATTAFGKPYPGGYGCNAVECWGMQIPVIAGADEWTSAKMTELWGELPFYVATEDTLVDAIRSLVKSKDLRKEHAAKGFAHVKKWHDEKPALAMLTELYMQTFTAYKSAPGRVEFALGPGTFTTELPNLRPVRIGNQQYHFINGRLHIEDPRMAQKMRSIAAARKQFRIVEVSDAA